MKYSMVPAIKRSEFGGKELIPYLVSNITVLILVVSGRFEKGHENLLFTIGVRKLRLSS